MSPRWQDKNMLIIYSKYIILEVLFNVYRYGNRWINFYLHNLLMDNSSKQKHLPIFYKSHINRLHHTVIVIPALAITTFCKREITLNSVYCIGWVNVVLFNLVSTMLENLQNLIQYIMTAIQHVEPPSYFQFPYWRGSFKGVKIKHITHIPSCML